MLLHSSTNHLNHSFLSSVMPTRVMMALTALALSMSAHAASPSSPVVIPAKVELGSSICPTPNYPAKSVRDNEQGKVTVEVNIDAEGVLSDVNVVQSSGFSSLDKKMKSHLLSGTCKGTPSTVDGVAQPSKLKFSF